MLLQRIASGDSSAVAQCIERYGNLIWSTARRWSTSAADAEDAVQEIFIDLWQSAHRFNPQVATESTFVMMIARRRLIDRRRRAGSSRPDNTAAELEQVVDPAGSAAAAQLEVLEDVAIAKQAIEQLDVDERKILELSVHEGLSHSEIAAKIGLPLGTVKSHIRRGLQKVRDKIRCRMPQAALRSSS